MKVNPKRTGVRRWSAPCFESLEPRCLLTNSLMISEFVAANIASFEDAHFESPDWIEIHNRGETPILLRNYFLSDDPLAPRKWQFPDHIAISPGQYHIILASGRDIVDSHGFLHTNFRLDAGGEYLSLTSQQDEVLTEFDSAKGTFPPTRADIAYGYANGANTTADLPGYLGVPTPGASNSRTVWQGILQPPELSHTSAFHEETFELRMVAPEPGVSLIYTTDASTPSVTNGVQVDPTDPDTTAAAVITIDRTTVVQAVAVKPDFINSLTQGGTYLFSDQIVTQQPPLRESPFDFTFDDAFVQQWMANETLRDEFTDDLHGLPTVAISMTNEDLWDTETGIYANWQFNGGDWRRHGTVDVFDGQHSASTAAIVKTVGSATRENQDIEEHTAQSPPDKSSFRIDINSGEMKGAHSIANILGFGDAAIDSFALRISDNDRSSENGTYVRDAWSRETISSGVHAQVRSRPVNLFVNGLYWGLVLATERPREEFAKATFGDSDYDIYEPGDRDDEKELHAGDLAAWNALQRATSKQVPNDVYSSLTTPDAYDGYRGTLLDSQSLIRYTLTHVFSSSTDWPYKNTLMLRDRSATSPGYRFIAWDQELILTGTPFDVRDETVGYYDWVDRSQGNVRTAEGTSLGVFYGLLDSSDFR
ncbi:CotH kinase family protein, partial [Planctomycetota bacterium]